MKITSILVHTHRIAAAVAFTLSAHAATDTWVGNTSANWNAANWTGGNAIPIALDLLAFGAAGTAGPILNNDLAALLAINGITFNAGASAFTLNGNAITLGGNVANSSTSIETINLAMSMPALRTFTTVTGGGNLSLGGVLSGTGGFAAAGVGTIFVANAANTFTGVEDIGNGAANAVSTIVNVASLSDYGVASSIGARLQSQETATGSGIGLHFRGGILQYTGSTPQSTNREIRILNGTAGGTIDASGSDPSATINFTHTGTNFNLFDTGGTRTLTLTGSNTGSNRFSILLTNQSTNQTSLQKTGAGKWLIANSDNPYTGETIIAGGILNVASVSDYGVVSSIGSRAGSGTGGASLDENSSVTGVGLHFRGGTLQYTGSTPQSTNRNIRILNGNGATIDASGSVPGATLSFTHTGANVNLFDTGGTRTLTLTGTNPGNNGFSIQLLDQAGNATSLTKSGLGTWLLNGPDANVNNGTTTVNNGILALGKAGVIAVNAGLTIGNGTNSAAVLLDSIGTGGNQIADATVPILNTAGVLRVNNQTETIGGLNSSGAGVVENESGVAGTGTLTVNVTGIQFFSGILRDGDGAGTDGVLAFTKTGTGTQTLSGANTHTGATTINGGTLSVDGSLAAGSAVQIGNTGVLNGIGTVNGPVTIGNTGRVNGTLTFTSTVNVQAGGILSGDGNIMGSVATAGGARIIPGTSTIAGTLTIASLSLVTGATVDMEFGGSNDAINITGAGGLSIGGGGFNLFDTGLAIPLVTNGSYTLLDYTSSYSGAIGNLSIANAQPGKFYTLADDTTNTIIVLTIGDATVSEWNGAAANGLWTTGGALGNWSASATPNAPGAVAKFGAIPGAPTTVAVDGGKIVGGIIFDNPNGYTLTGGAADTITLNNGIAAAGLSVNSGSHTVSAPVVLATSALTSVANGSTLTLSGDITGAKSFTSSGLGTTILTGTNGFTITNVTNGTLQIGSNSTTGTLGSGDVNVAPGGTLIFHRSNDLTVANNILGAGAQITKLGVGTLTLGGNNAFATTGAGSFNLNEGTVKLGSATAVSAGVVLAFSGGTLDLNENGVNTSFLSGPGGTITDNGSNLGTTVLTVNQATDSTYGGSISNGVSRTIAINKLGSGTLKLGGSDTFSGPLAITNGAVIAAGTAGNVPVLANVTLGDGSNNVWLIAGGGVSDQQFGVGTVVSFTNAAKNAKFMLRSSSQTVAGVDSSINFTTSLSIIQNDEVGSPGYTGAVGIGTLTIDATTDHSFTGLIRNQVGTLNLVKEGVGTQEIKNVLAQADNFGTLTVNNGKFLINFTTNANNTNTLGAGTTVVVNGPGTLGLDGGWTMNRAISGNGSVLKQGSGTITMNGLNSYSGTTRIINGTLAVSTAGTSLPGNVTIGDGSAANIFLVMGAANQFGPNSVVTFNNGTGNNAKMELRGFAQTIGGLQSDADDTLSIVQNQETGAPAATTLTIDTAANYIFNGLIRTQLGGLLSIVKNGSGTQEIRNIPAQADNFGTLTINDGKFTVNFSGATNTLGANTSVTVQSPGVLGLDGTWNMNRAITGTGKVLKQGTGDVVISGAQSYAQLETTGGTTTLTTSLANAAITNSAGTLNVNADATNSTVNVATITNFGVSGNLAALNILDGGVATLGTAGMAASAEDFGTGGGTDLAQSGVQAVPEPGSAALIFGGMLTLLGLRRRRA